MDVLLALVDAGGRVMSKSELLDAVWTGLYIGDDVLSTAIWELRRALGDDARSPRLIGTVARRGYRLLQAPEPVAGEIGAPQPAVPSTGVAGAAATPGVRRGAWIAAVVVGLAAVVLVARWSLPRRAPLPIQSVVVLPLVSLGGNAEDGALADGITDSLTTALARIGGLRVVSRTTAMAYRQAAHTTAEIAADLGVDAVVEGTLAREGPRIVLNVQLIDARDEAHLWAETYERGFDSLLDLQVEMARSVGAAIASRLRLPVHPPSVPPPSPDASESLLAWRFRTGGEVWSDPVVAGDSVVFGSRDGVLYAASAANGAEGWRRSVGGPVLAPPLVLDGSVYSVTRDGWVVAVELASGRERWRHEVGGSVVADLAEIAGQILAGDEDGLLVALDAGSGRRLWTWRGGDGVTAVAAGGGRVLVSRFDGAVTALDATGGTPLWTTTLAHWLTRPAVLDGDRVLVPTAAGKVVCLKAGDGSEIWRADVPAPSEATVWRDRIVVAGDDDAVRALDRSTGAELWTFEALGKVEHPVVIGDTLYAASHDNNLYALDPWSGRLRWRAEMQTWVTTPPVGAGGLVVFGSLDGSLYGLRAPGESATPVLVRQDAGFTSSSEADDTRPRGFDVVVDRKDRPRPRVRWRFKAGGAVQLAPAIGKDLVFASARDQLFAIDLESGTERWRTRLTGEVGTVPALGGDLLLVGSRDGAMTAFGAADGSERWRFVTGGDVISSPTIAGGTAFFGSRDGHLYALDVAAGSERWRRRLDVIHASPAVAGGVVFVPGRHDALWAVSASDGRILWQGSTSDWAVADPLVVGNEVLTASCDGVVQAFDRREGREIWSLRTGGAIWYRPALAQGNAYFGSADYHVYAIDAASGREAWRHRTGNRVLSSVATWRDLVFAGSHDRQLWALQAANGRVAWSIRTTGIVGSPAVAGDLLAVGSSDRHLYLVELSSASD